MPINGFVDGTRPAVMQVAYTAKFIEIARQGDKIIFFGVT
jgi:hypothetical protein